MGCGGRDTINFFQLVGPRLSYNSEKLVFSSILEPVERIIGK